MIMLPFQRCTRHLPLRIQQKIPLLPFHLNLPMNRLPVSALIMLRFRKFIYERKTNFTFEYRPKAGKTHSFLMCFSCRPFSIFPIFSIFYFQSLSICSEFPYKFLLSVHHPLRSYNIVFHLPKNAEISYSADLKTPDILPAHKS